MGVAVRLFRFGQGNLLDRPTSLLNGPRLFAIGQGLFGLSLEFTDNLFGFDAEVALEVDGIAAAGVDDILPLRRDLVLFFAQSSSSFRASRRRYSSSACSSSIFLACALSWVRTFSISMS